MIQKQDIKCWFSKHERLSPHRRLAQYDLSLSIFLPLCHTWLNLENIITHFWLIGEADG